MAQNVVIHEPLKEYAVKYKEIFRKNAADAFETLVKCSGVDVAANKLTCRHIKSLQKRADFVALVLNRLRTLDWILIFLMVAGGILVFFFILRFFEPLIPVNIYWGAGGGVAAFFSLLLKYCILDKKISSLEATGEKIRKTLEAEMAEAYGQMGGMNQLYEWDTVTDLVMKSCPVFTFDKFFSSARMAELERKFHFQSENGKDSSILFCHSGSINDNPFVLADTLNFTMGTEVYTGSLTITWVERVTYTDSNGKVRSRMETRVQTLYATVEKPCPEYARKNFLIFGCGAAPELVFSRTPSGLAGLGKGFFHRIKMKWAIRDLVKRSNDMSNNFTIMSNHEFDAVFAALDRNNEREFRLLFTPLAQQEMLKILRDKKYGFGEDFLFRKKKMINFLSPGSLRNFDVSARPGLFIHYDLEAARKIFNEYSNEFFRRIYFAFAPLLAIPLYQQHEAPGDIFQEDTLYYASSWEHEATANFYDRNTFKDPSCITDCILKTSPRYNGDGTTTLSVTAHGFGGNTRVDYVPVFGGDGRFHDVPVEWVEYYPVSHTSSLVLREVTEQGETRPAHELFPGHNTREGDVKNRRNISFYIPR